MARAIVRNTPILILDEPTTGLDARSEHDVVQALEQLMKGRTCLVIAHHLETIRRADIIFVLNDSAIVERGTTTRSWLRAVSTATCHRPPGPRSFGDQCSSGCLLAAALTSDPPPGAASHGPVRVLDHFFMTHKVRPRSLKVI